MTSTASSTTPVADARAPGLAHYAASGVLEHVLARHGVTFQQQAALRSAAEPKTPDHLVTQVRDSLKTDPAGIRDTLGELLAERLLVEDGTHLRTTDTGRELLAAIGRQTAPVSHRIRATSGRYP
ncbi:MarR family transcriptional regulator [Streptomyces sp. NPDC085665]|uniref:MarR family transcriptional regulator n=1 Tax=Streptomyces sp. NPDC085665 TaxID=3365735 RepID=UPI0037D46904